MQHIALVLCLATACAGAKAPRNSRSDLSVEFELPKLGGDRLGSRDLRGQVVLLDFWATWCVPCKESLPFYQALADARAAKGLRVVAVSVDSDVSEVDRFVAERGLQLDILLDPEGSLPERLDVRAMPTLFLLDRGGKVIWQHGGFNARDKRMIEERVDAALAN